MVTSFPLMECKPCALNYNSVDIQTNYLGFLWPFHCLTSVFT